MNYEDIVLFAHRALSHSIKVRIADVNLYISSKLRSYFLPLHTVGRLPLFRNKSSSIFLDNILDLIESDITPFNPLTLKIHRDKHEVNRMTHCV